MERKITGNIQIEGAKLIFKNFQGKKSEYNDEGNRNFGVLLDEWTNFKYDGEIFDHPEDALEDDGWRVKHLRPRPDDPDQIARPWLPIKVKFGNIPPIAVLINSRGKKRLDEETIGQLDWSVIKNCDLIIRPYNYPASHGRPAGVSAYLKAIYVTISEDDLADKYADVPDMDGDEYDS